jgi:hypothetical protein
VIATVLAAVSAAIAVAVYRGWHTKAFLGLSIVVSLAFWVFGQGFGGIFTGQATDVNVAPLLILMASLLYGAVSIRLDHRRVGRRGEVGGGQRDRNGGGGDAPDSGSGRTG